MTGSRPPIASRKYTRPQAEATSRAVLGMKPPELLWRTNRSTMRSRKKMRKKKKP
jgi:hypothetical protein